jgi:hypothetical protein
MPGVPGVPAGMGAAKQELDARRQGWRITPGVWYPRLF